MEFKDVLTKRHSVRDFKPDEVPDDILKNIIELAAKTPSWENSQPWNVYIVKGDVLDKIHKEWIEEDEAGIKGNPDMPTEHRTNFSQRGQKNMADFMDEIAECIDPDDPDDGADKFERFQTVLFKAPVLVYLTLPKGSTKYSIYDLGAFGVNLMSAATEYGVDSIPAYVIVKHPHIIRRNIDVPDDEDLIMGIALGYSSDEKVNSYKSPRLSPDEILKIYK